MHESWHNQITVTKADALILPLVKRFFRDQGMRAQAAKADIVFIASLKPESSAGSEKIIGALRLCPVGESWLLRSMSISADYQRRGIGRFMLAQIRTTLQETQCYCFAYTHLEAFYQQAGFQIHVPDQCPPAVRQLYEQYLSAGKQISLMQFQPDDIAARAR